MDMDASVGISVDYGLLQDSMLEPDLQPSTAPTSPFFFAHQPKTPS